MNITHTRTVDASPAEVWSVLADYFDLARWASAISHSSALTHTPAGPGASRRVQAGAFTLVENVVEWEPEHTLAYEIVGMPPMLRSVVNRWELTVTGDTTKVSLTATVVPGPKPPMKLAAQLLGRRIGATNAGLVRDLAGAATAAAPHPVHGTEPEVAS